MLVASELEHGPRHGQEHEHEEDWSGHSDDDGREGRTDKTLVAEHAERDWQVQLAGRLEEGVGGRLQLEHIFERTSDCARELGTAELGMVVGTLCSFGAL